MPEFRFPKDYIDSDAKINRDFQAHRLRAEGYKVKIFREIVMMYPPSTYPPKRYCYIHKVPTTVYCVKTIGRKRKA
jgi:hypothetical protein